MTATLATPMGRTSLRFSPEILSTGASRFTHNMSFSGRGVSCNASLHAVAEPAPVLDMTTIRRPASLYEVLRVKRNASPTEIKAAYRTLAKVYHPDASDFMEDGRDFIEIHKAYATLSDPAARSLYDLSLNAELRRRSFGYSGVGSRTRFYSTRSWETDQCW